MHLRRILSLVFLAASAVANHAKSMKASDYFEPQLQRAFAEAAAGGRIDRLEKLHSEGAQINFQGKEGMTALMWAFLHQNKPGFEYLLNHGADPNIQMARSRLTSDGLTDGSSVMSLAAMHEDPWYLRLTLQHGGNPNILNPVKHLTPIFQCIMLLDHSRPRPRIEQLKMLINAGANLEARTSSDITPMMYAVRFNRYDMAYAMLESGADPRAKTKWGTTIVYEIKESRTDPESELYQWRLKFVDLLRSKGIDVALGG